MGHINYYPYTTSMNLLVSLNTSLKDDHVNFVSKLAELEVGQGYMFFSMLFIKLQWHCEHFLPPGVFKCYFIKDQILPNSHSSRPKLHAVKVVKFESLILCPKGRISLILSSVQRRELASYKTLPCRRS